MINTDHTFVFIEKSYWKRNRCSNMGLPLKELLTFVPRIEDSGGYYNHFLFSTSD